MLFTARNQNRNRSTVTLVAGEHIEPGSQRRGDGKKMATADDLILLCAEVQDQNLSDLLKLYFRNPDIMEKFTAAPASTVFHGNIPGGLLNHTVGVARICQGAMAQFPALNHDLLLTGALIHDIGKIECYYETKSGVEARPVFHTSATGRMLNHIPVGAAMLRARTEESTGFPKDLAVQLEHMILSHHGPTKNGWGSAVDPVTVEAVTLHYADLMDSQIVGQLQRQGTR